MRLQASARPFQAAAYEMQVPSLNGRFGAGPSGDLAVEANLIEAAPGFGIVHRRAGGIVSIEPGAALQR
jgi:hypothetical protein